MLFVFLLLLKLRYRERIKNKYLSNKKDGLKSQVLDAKQWVFVKDGLDDFRDGMPPPHEDILIKVWIKTIKMFLIICIFFSLAKDPVQM